MSDAWILRCPSRRPPHALNRRDGRLQTSPFSVLSLDMPFEKRPIPGEEIERALGAEGGGIAGVPAGKHDARHEQRQKRVRNEEPAELVRAVLNPHRVEERYEEPRLEPQQLDVAG